MESRSRKRSVCDDDDNEDDDNDSRLPVHWSQNIILEHCDVDVPSFSFSVLLILGGAVWHEHIDGANAAMIFIAGYGVWYLSAGFSLKYYINQLRL